MDLDKNKPSKNTQTWSSATSRLNTEPKIIPNDKEDDNNLTHKKLNVKSNDQDEEGNELILDR